MDKKALHTLSYGLYIVSSRKDNAINGQIANTAVQATSRPTVVSISINTENLTHEYIEESGVFTISVLSVETPLKLIGTFGFKSGRDIDKFASVNYTTGVTGAPIIRDSTVAYLEAKVIDSVHLSTHTVFFGEVVAAEILDDADPMTYAFYHDVKGGKTPPKAATYNEEPPKTPAADTETSRYVCTICGYIYDPETGDPDNGVPADTPFEALPADWTCPVCGASKEKFVTEGITPNETNKK